MGKSYDIDLTEYVPFERVTDEDLLKSRIFNKCRMSDTGCWIWTGPQNGKGYGVFYIGTKNRHAHRCSYEAFKGAIKDGMHVRHRCDTPLCVNPAHLLLGTAKDNAADRKARDRGHKLRGELVGTAKLTERDVREIRASELGDKALSEKYGVAPSHIWLVRTGRAWKHVAALEK